MWVDTQKMTDSDEEAEALERTDFETMEAIRQRVAEIVEDPDTAKNLSRTGASIASECASMTTTSRHSTGPMCTWWTLRAAVSMPSPPKAPS